MIDMHIHTTYSDGTKTVKEILKEAQRIGLDYISITDHENCMAYKEIEERNLKQYYHGTLIPGVEIKVAYKGRIIDILGYGIDTDKIQRWSDNFYKDKTHAQIQTKYLKSQYNTFQKVGCTLIPYEEIKWDPDHDWANVIIYKEIKSHPENERKCPNDLWERYSNFRYHHCYSKDSIFYIDKSSDVPTIEEGMKQIHDAGGLAFLAHIYIYDWATNKKALIDDLISNYEFDGIECYYSQFSEKEIKYVLEVCEKRGLYKSGGCDYHGDNKPGIHLGVGKGNLKIPNQIIEEWCEGFRNVPKSFLGRRMK